LPSVGVCIWPGTPARAALRLGRKVEELGYDSLWVVESTAAPSRDAVSLLGAIAATTERIRLATGIINVYTRSPLLIATTVAHLDEISGGRVILGLGAGHRFSIEGWHSTRFERPVKRVREYITSIRMLLTGERVSFQGETVSIQGARLAQRPPRSQVPIYAAGVGERMVKGVAGLADGLLLAFNPVERVERVLGWLREVGVEPGGFGLAAYILSFISRDGERAWAAAKRVVAAYCAAPFYTKVFREAGFGVEAERVSKLWWSGDTTAAAREVSLEMASRFVVVGGVEEVAERVREFVRVGVKMPVIAPFYFEGEEDYLGSVLAAIPGHLP
jgi:5,10-methylenetetrahydromethanopterin reductase